MKIYKIISLSLIALFCAIGIIVGLVAINHYYYGYYTSYEYYGGDAYTGIQHAAADTSRNVYEFGGSVESLIQIGGWVIFVCFFIKLLTTVGKLIEAIIDYKKYYAEKKKEKMEQMMAYQNYVNQTQGYAPPVNEFKTSQ